MMNNNTNHGDDHPEMSPAYLAFCEEQEAIYLGLATELTHCYLCYLDSTGKPDMSQKQDQGPLRGILRHAEGKTHPTHPEADRYDVLHLSCGHAII